MPSTKRSGETAEGDAVRPGGDLLADPPAPSTDAGDPPAATSGVHRISGETVDAAVRESQELAAQFEEEKPGRVLTGPLGLLVTGLATAVALLALWQVFDPLSQGSKYYLIFFLAGVLPLAFLAYPAGLAAPGWLHRLLPARLHPAAGRRRVPTGRRCWTGSSRRSPWWSASTRCCR